MVLAKTSFSFAANFFFMFANSCSIVSAFFLYVNEQINGKKGGGGRISEKKLGRVKSMS